MSVEAQIPRTEVPPESLMRITVERYRQMGEAGIFGEDEHVELLEGLLIVKEPVDGAQGSMFEFLNGFLVRGVGEDFNLRPLLPLALGPYSEPEPDFAVVPARRPRSSSAHPTTALLVIEVARKSLRIDRGIKAKLYARAGVPEYWIINLKDRVVEVHREPDAQQGNYLHHQVLRDDDILEPQHLPGPRISVKTLFAWG